MNVLDSDAHVEEWAETFGDSYLDEEFRDRRPQVVGTDAGRAYWMVEDRLFPRFEGRGCNILGTPTGYGTVLTEISAVKKDELDSMELRTVDSRLKAMNAEGIDLQVIYPTLFLAPPLSQDPALQAALVRSYNSWISAVCRRKPECLKWVATIELNDVEEALREMRRTKKLGAVGAMICGTVGDRNLDEPEFRPFWATAAELDMSIAVHVAWSLPALNNMYDHLFTAASVPFVLPSFMAFVALISSGILDDHPTLRVGFFELGCEWIPFWKARMDHFYEFAAERVKRALPPCKRKPSAYLNSGQLYVTCEVDDALLPYVIDLLGDEHILFASDMPHSDRELFAVKTLQERSDLSEAAKKKIVCDNVVRFYNL